MKQLFTALTVLLISSISYSQTNFTIHGIVSDSIGKPIDDGTVSLFNQNDSTLVKYSMITKGVFNFSSLKQGNYFIKISCLGYEDKLEQVKFNSTETLLIRLKQKPTALKEIQISGNKKTFSYKNGNIKATVENTYLSSIPDAIEILAKLPTVQVSGDRESINILGKGNPIIYIENQRITLNELNALSVNDIKSIEIINNPSSKYEAEGRAVILITRKTNSKEGTKIDVTETASIKRYFENRAGINASFKKKKTELKCNVQYNHINRFEGLDGVLNSAMYNYESNFYGTSIGPRKQFLYGVGIYHQINEYDYFSVNVNGRLQNEDAEINTNSYSNQAGLITNTVSKNTNLSDRPFINSNFNYLKKFNTINSQLFIGGQYAQYKTNVGSNISNNYNNTQLLLTEQRKQNFTVDVGAARIDFEKSFKENMKWESGGVLNFSNSLTIFDVNNVPNSSETITQYNYKENNQALYSQLSGKYKKSSYTMGLRVENTQLQGGYKDSSQLLLDRNFVYLFPKINISIPVDSFKTITINYARSIRRPNYANANQVSNYITPFLERTNNININPSITDEISLNFQYKTYSLNAAAYQIQNSISYITEYDTTIKKYRMINRNIAIFSGINISLTIPFTYKILTSSNELMATMNQVNDTRANQLKTTPFYYFYSNNQFKLPKNYTLVLSGWLITNQYEGLFLTNNKFAIDISLSKTFYKKLTCTINTFDIFRSLNNTESFTINNIYASTTYLENVKEFAVALKYSFGKIKEPKFKNKEVNENGNRLN